MVVENVRGAQKWVGRAPYHYGSFYLWGDIPALMPLPHKAVKHDGSGWRENGTLVSSNRMVPDGLKVPGIKLSNVGFNVAAAQRYREGIKQSGISGVRNNGKGDKRFQDGAARHGSKSDSRKAASAMIAKIPFPLSQHIARTFKPLA